ncbi:alpha/beta fold hydrolase [Anaerotignum sp. MB30-C6]|uniref:alpha/beta fold hydrolase n=1 Tax=Anaerotignum sp. MB30-C6 TaxID=3070814 RepID=UPI0027DEA53B|nr:alpha/beta hydrolase [Anaerotignum sp. MB30-C6]WMI80302.1 alpha/beta hydrolase [Anaerotignum sp. MB30-C6]
MSYFTFENKQVFYQELGSGTPLLLLHGNTASSKMFEEIAEQYAQNHKVVLIDFLGHGKSQRIDEFPNDLWFFEAKQVIAFLDEKNYKRVDLIGSSGGALVAINVALERPDLIHKVIADSFEGETPLEEFTKNVVELRELSKHDNNAVLFYSLMHGEDWEQVVDCDTLAIANHAKEIGKFFHKPLEQFLPPLLLTGSKEDEFISAIDPSYFEKVYSKMIGKIDHGEMHLFPKGGHPAMLTSPQEFLTVSEGFLKKELD